jgi:hypothetical protein
MMGHKADLGTSVAIPANETTYLLKEWTYTPSGADTIVVMINIQGQSTVSTGPGWLTCTLSDANGDLIWTSQVGLVVGTNPIGVLQPIKVNHVPAGYEYPSSIYRLTVTGMTSSDWVGQVDSLSVTFFSVEVQMQDPSPEVS